MTALIVGLIWLVLAAVASEIADRKGRRRWPWFLLGLLVSGLLAIGLVLALPDPRRLCPSCGTHCPESASACRGCGRDLPPLVGVPIERWSPLEAGAVGLVVLIAVAVLAFVGWTWATLST